MTVPRIDIIVVRDPDYETEVTVYIDGKETTVHQWTFDPGAGYEKADYKEMRDSDLAAAPEFLKPVLRRIYEEMRPAFKRWSTGGWS
jgi:hypothetical protein